MFCELYGWEGYEQAGPHANKDVLLIQSFVNFLWLHGWPHEFSMADIIMDNKQLKIKKSAFNPNT